MNFMDGHCDVLCKMWLNFKQSSFYDVTSAYDTSYQHLQEGNVIFQTFALFVPADIGSGQRFDCAIKQIDLFYEQICQDEKKFFLITSGAQLADCSPSRVGALLHLEGAEALQGRISYLRTFYRLGVRQMGLTWNHANEVADGIGEERGGGLTQFGFRVIAEMKRLGMILDVSHLSEKGFWEVVQHQDLPVVASHSNTRALCRHIRNLDDEQINVIIQRKGLIGLTFVPSFVRNLEHEATIDDLLNHIDHICTLGGEKVIFFGSDFDGFTRKIPNLEHAGHYNHLREELLKRFPESLVKRWAWNNGAEFYKKHLIVHKV